MKVDSLEKEYNEEIAEENSNPVVEEESEESEDSQRYKKTEKSWNDLKFIPNKKRFILLTTIVTAIELAGLFIFAYPLTNNFGQDITDLGLFLLPPFSGALIAYFVQDKKEAVGVSAINASGSLIPFVLIYSLVEVYIIKSPDFQMDLYYFLIPSLAILIQIAIAFTIARLRVIYRDYGDSSITREDDEALIIELEASREERKADNNSKNNFDIEGNEEK